MCYAKPGPRCSKHAKEDYRKAVAGGNPTEIQLAKEAFARTPDGIKQLRAQGRNALADSYEADREAAIDLHNRYQAEVKRLEHEYTEWSSQRTPVKIDPKELYATTDDIPVPEGERISARRTKATDSRRAARDFSSFTDLPIAYGDANTTQWTTMDDHRSEFSYANFTAVRNAETSPEGILWGIHPSKPANGFWSASGELSTGDQNGMNQAGVPTTWWMRMHSDAYGDRDMTREEQIAEETYQTREMQNKTIALVPREDAAIIRCETKEHYLNVVQRYYNPKLASLDFQKMRKDGFDGFSVSRPVAKSGFPPPGTHPFEAQSLRGMSGWDGDSTVWFDKQSFDVVKPHQDSSHRMTEADFGNLHSLLNNKTSSSEPERQQSEDPLAGLRKLLDETPSEVEDRYYRENPRPEDESLADLRRRLIG